jgi:6-phosphogluconolactonase
MKSIWKGLLGGFILLAFVPASLSALDVVYTNNDLASGNTVSAYAVDTNGLLGLIASYNTGGTGAGGGLYASNRIIVVKNFLYASNAGSNNVSAFTIDTITGALTAVAGSPFATGGSNYSPYTGISLAGTPDGKYLFAGSPGSQDVTVFSIGSGGALTQVGSRVYVAGTMSSMKVSPNGRFLALAFPYASEVAVYSIASDGTLQAVTNSPFSVGASATGVDINCASNYVFVGLSGSSSVEVFNIDSTGALTSNSTSAPVPNVYSAQVVQLSPDDNTLYVSNQGAHAVSAFAVASDGSLTLAAGTPVGTGNQFALPGGLSVNGDGTFLYAASALPAVTVYGIGGSTALVRDSYNPLAPQAYGLLSVAAYPPKVCSLPTTLTATLDITTGPPPSYDLKATFDVGSGVDLLAQPVTLQIGDYSVTIPAGSFKTYQNGTNAETYLFQGVIGSVTLKVQIVPLGENQFQITAFGKQVDLTGQMNPVSVQVAAGGNSASTSVNATLVDNLRGLWSAQ